MNVDRWLSKHRIAAHLGVKIETIYLWISKKSSPAHKVGCFWKFEVNEVDAWVKSGGVAAKSARAKTDKAAGDSGKL